MKIKVLELFGGIGAPRKALENLGLTVESDYVEIDKYAVNSYNAIFDENEIISDVCEFSGIGKKYNLLIHGSPCQDFSIAGGGAGGEIGSGTRSSLMWETVRIIEECRPQVVIWENVKSLINNKHVHTFQLYLKTLENLGYTNSYQVLNSVFYGVPQERETNNC